MRFKELIQEGEMIPFPARMLRIAGAPLDFYQLLKMTANANLAHKVQYKQTSRDAGANLTEVIMVFYDDISFAEAKQLFDHYGIVYTEETEIGSVGTRKGRFTSKNNPPSDGDVAFS